MTHDLDNTSNTVKLLVEYDRAITSDPEYSSLRKAIHKFSRVAGRYSLIISTSITKVMEILGFEPVRSSKIIIDNIMLG